MTFCLLSRQKHGGNTSHLPLHMCSLCAMRKTCCNVCITFRRNHISFATAAKPSCNVAKSSFSRNLRKTFRPSGSNDISIAKREHVSTMLRNSRFFFLATQWKHCCYVVTIMFLLSDKMKLGFMWYGKQSSFDYLAMSLLRDLNNITFTSPSKHFSHVKNNRTTSAFSWK